MLRHGACVSDLVTGNFSPVNGSHRSASNWGWGSAASIGFNSVAVSYAYPAGASIKAINSVVIP